MILGIDISDHDVAVILAQPDGAAELALRSALPREGGAAAIWMAAMETARTTLLRGHIEPAQIKCVGLAFNALIDERGVIGKDSRAAGWQGYDLNRAVREHLGVAESVAENRVLCEALGEWRFGALRPSQQGVLDNWLYVHIGSSIDGAAMIGGQLLWGAARAAVTVGAICIERDGALCASGRRGCLEGYCGGEAFVARARSYSLTLKTPREIWELADSNFLAQSLCEDYVQRLAQGLGSAVAMLNPSRLVLGGELANAVGEQLLAPLRLRIKEYCLPVHFGVLEIYGAQLGEDAAVLGAVALAMQQRIESTGVL